METIEVIVLAFLGLGAVCYLALTARKAVKRLADTKGGCTGCGCAQDPVARIRNQQR